MQPYLFPYLGYFHLLDAVDKFVVLDDVKCPKNGWINRNRVLVNGSPVWFTVPLSSKTKQINEKEYLIDSKLGKKLQLTLSMAYPRSPNLSTVLPWLQDLVDLKKDGVVKCNLDILRKSMGVLGMKSPEILVSSKLNVKKDLRGEEKILEICSLLDCETYVNLPGGVNLYNRVNFESRDIDLVFIQSNFNEYTQRTNTFVPRLSVLDLLLSENRNYDSWIKAPFSYSLSSSKA
jgi:hypothetical protein